MNKCFLRLCSTAMEFYLRTSETLEAKSNFFRSCVLFSSIKLFDSFVTNRWSHTHDSFRHPQSVFSKWQNVLNSFFTLFRFRVIAIEIVQKVFPGNFAPLVAGKIEENLFNKIGKISYFFLNEFELGSRFIKFKYFKKCNEH